jgi:hypothetical protein
VDNIRGRTNPVDCLRSSQSLCRFTETEVKVRNFKEDKRLFKKIKN